MPAGLLLDAAHRERTIGGPHTAMASVPGMTTTAASLCREEKRMMVMRRYYNYTIWFIAFVLLIFSTGCCNPGTNPASVPPTVAP
jgi:hypothetical protein